MELSEKTLAEMKVGADRVAHHKGMDELRKARDEKMAAEKAAAEAAAPKPLDPSQANIASIHLTNEQNKNSNSDLG